MWRVIMLATLQSVLLTGGQVFLKFALLRMGAFAVTREFFVRLLVNWPFAACGLCFGAASVVWMYMIRHFPLSVAYPMVSLSYVFGMIAAIVFFHEAIPVTRWVGVLLIMIGCVFVAR